MLLSASSTCFLAVFRSAVSCKSLRRSAWNSSTGLDGERGPYFVAAVVPEREQRRPEPLDLAVPHLHCPGHLLLVLLDEVLPHGLQLLHPLLGEPGFELRHRDRVLALLQLADPLGFLSRLSFEFRYLGLLPWSTIWMSVRLVLRPSLAAWSCDNERLGLLALFRPFLDIIPFWMEPLGVEFLSSRGCHVPAASPGCDSSAATACCPSGRSPQPLPWKPMLRAGEAVEGEMQTESIFLVTESDAASEPNISSSCRDFFPSLSAWRRC